MAKTQDGRGRRSHATRFQKGRSGNPKGRPKGSLNTKTLLEKALDDKLFIIENGTRRRISKREAGAKQFANKVATGDLKAFTTMLKTESENDGDRKSHLEQFPVDREDMLVIQNLLKRLLEGDLHSRKDTFINEDE